MDWLDQALALQQAVLPPVVLTEVLSAPNLDHETAEWLRDPPVLDIRSGFWERAAETRARILAKRLRARLADTLIAQTCIDHCVPLVTRDRDFRALLGPRRAGSAEGAPVGGNLSNAIHRPDALRV